MESKGEERRRMLKVSFVSVMVKVLSCSEEGGWSAMVTSDLYIALLMDSDDEEIWIGVKVGIPCPLTPFVPFSTETFNPNFFRIPRRKELRPASCANNSSMSLTKSGPPSALFNCAARILLSTFIFKGSLLWVYTR